MIDGLDEKIIAMLHVRGLWRYYAAHDDFWIMDWESWNASLPDSYRVVDLDCKSRFGICVLNEETIDSFMDYIVDFQVSCDILRNILRGLNANEQNDARHLLPSVLIDFESKKLFSNAEQNYGYENYVPAGWSGFFCEYYDMIPFDYRYWIDNDVD